VLVRAGVDMIIGQDVLRLLTVKALRGATWAGPRVYDSPAQPADMNIVNGRAPFIGVYTDDAEIDLDGQSLHNGTAHIHLLIECAAADKITVAADGGAPATGAEKMTLAQTDEGLELIIGFVARQAVQALMATGNPWAELWRQFTTPGRERVEIRRGGPGQDRQESAIRYASRIMRMTLIVLADPVYGEGVLSGFWPTFLRTCDADAELAGTAALIRAHFETEPGLPSWRVAQKQGTYTHDAMMALGIAPLPIVVPDEEEPPPLKQVIIVDDDRGGPVNMPEGAVNGR
jgi:hypothetical protein